MTDQENTETQSFASDHIKVELKREPKCQVTLEVEGDETLAKEAKKRAIRDIAKEVSIPGFRKGKAPAAIIEKKFPDALKERWEKAFADQAFPKANQLAQMRVLNGNSRITFNMKSLDDTGGKASFSFEAEPEVPQINWGDFELPQVQEEPVDEKKINETVENLRMFYATWNEVKDRPVQEGDYVILDIDDLDQDPPVQAFSNARFEVKPKKMASWMRQLVIGKQVGESVEGVSEPDEDESEQVKKDFEKKNVKIHIKTIESPDLPELNNEFAERLGAKTIDEMHQRLKSLLEKQEKERVIQEKRNSLVEQIRKKVIFDIPASSWEKEANHRMTTFLKQGEMTKKWNEEWSEEQKEAKKEEVKQEAETALRLFYLCRQIVSDNHLQIKPEEIAPSYTSLLDMMFADPAQVNFHNQSEQQQAMIYSKLMMAKAEDHMVELVEKENNALT